MKDKFNNPFKGKKSDPKKESTPFKNRNQDQNPSFRNSQNKPPYEKKYNPSAKRENRDDRNSDNRRNDKDSTKKFEGKNDRKFDRNSDNRRNDRDSNKRFEGKDDRKFDRNSDNRRNDRDSNKRFEGKDDRKFDRNSDNRRNDRDSNKKFEGKDNRKFDRNSNHRRNDRKFDRDSNKKFEGKDDKKFDRNSDNRGNDKGFKRKFDFKATGKRLPKTFEDKNDTKTQKTGSENVRLNRYIANAGICSRREADKLIERGEITINGNIVREMGYKVKKNDIVKRKGKHLQKEKNVYVLLNKPKDFITTVKDTHDRKTVMDLVKNACKERIYPVGRLDRPTTGLLLFTNDGELAKQLTHPSFHIQKIYRIELNKAIKPEDFDKILEGFELEDGFIAADSASILTLDKKVLGIELHSGRNRIVRRIFRHLGYEVERLDRTLFAGLSKERLPRGKWRHLSDKEVIKLKFFTGKKKKHLTIE